MHANYPTPQLAARGENGLYQAEVQLNFFTLPQFATSNGGRGGVRKAPLAFTEHGAIMAATVLSSGRAIRMSIFVVEAFVQMRDSLAAHKEIRRQLADLEARVGTHDQALSRIIQAIRDLTPPPPSPTRRRIGFVQD